jgi:hypothetical protein
MSPQQPDQSGMNPNRKEPFSFRHLGERLHALGKRAVRGGSDTGATPTTETTPKPAEEGQSVPKLDETEQVQAKVDEQLTLEEAIVKYNEAVIFGADAAAIKGLADQIDAISAERKKNPLSPKQALENFKSAVEDKKDADVIVQYKAVVDNALFIAGGRKAPKENAQGDKADSAPRAPRGPKEAFKKGFEEGRDKARRVRSNNRPSGQRPNNNSKKPGNNRNRNGNRRPNRPQQTPSKKA